MQISHKGTNKIVMTKGIKIEIELEAFKKMKCYIDLCDKEVGWLGTAYKVGNVITVKDVFLFEQQVHATTCELTPQGLADFTMELFNTMDSDDAMEITNNLTLWGHSHVNMGVTPSGQDETQLNSFASSEHEWFLRVIGNKKGDFGFTYIDYTTGMKITDMDWTVKIPGLDYRDMRKDIKGEVGQKVKTIASTSRWAWDGRDPLKPSVHDLNNIYTKPFVSSGKPYNSTYSSPSEEIWYGDGQTPANDYGYNPYNNMLLDDPDEEYELLYGEVSSYHDAIVAMLPEDILVDDNYSLAHTACSMFSIEDLLRAVYSVTHDKAIDILMTACDGALGEVELTELVDIYELFVDYTDNIEAAVLTHDGEYNPAILDSEGNFKSREHNEEAKPKKKAKKTESKKPGKKKAGRPKGSKNKAK